MVVPVHQDADHVRRRLGQRLDVRAYELDVTELARPRPVAGVPLPCAHNIYVARTYAYVAAGPAGLVILDVEKPEQPRSTLSSSRTRHGRRRRSQSAMQDRIFTNCKHRMILA